MLTPSARSPASTATPLRSAISTSPPPRCPTICCRRQIRWSLARATGEQVLLAILHGVPKIVAVELNPQIVALVRQDYAEFAGGIYDRPEVEVRIDEARSAVRRTSERYDLIQIPLLYSFGAAAAGTQSLHENYTYTVEAITDYLAALEPGGILSVTLWLKLPPRDSVKLFATAVEALRRTGVAEPGARLAMIRSWSTATILVKNGAFEPQEIAALRDFATARSFDIDWAPGLKSAETNRFNILERPYLYEAATALLGPDPQEFFEDYKFAVAPATDDRPYFFDFFKWRFLPELLALGPQGAAALLDMGYLILAATLVQAAALSAVLILAPLALAEDGWADECRRRASSATSLHWGSGFCLSRSPSSSASSCSSAIRSMPWRSCWRDSWFSPASAALSRLGSTAGSAAGHGRSP